MQGLVSTAMSIRDEDKLSNVEERDAEARGAAGRVLHSRIKEAVLSLAPALDHCQILFSELQGKLETAHGLFRNEEAGSSLKSSSFLKDRFRPIWERAKWPFTKGDLVKIRSRLKDAKSTLNMCLVKILATPQLK